MCAANPAGARRFRSGCRPARRPRTHPATTLLTDVVMPGGVDGRDLAREARAVHGIARVLLMSGHAPQGGERGGLRLLRKPFSPAQLAAALQEVAS